MESTGVGCPAPPRSAADRTRRLLARTRSALLACLEGLDVDQLRWQPDDGIPSIAHHLQHLARVEHALVGRLLLGTHERRQPAREFGPLPEWTLDHHLRDLERVRDASDVWIGAAAEECLFTPLPVPGPWGDLPIDLFEYLSHHDTHHRGSIVVLRRLMDPGRRFPALE